MNNKPITSINSAKLLGIQISNDLKWDNHVNSLINRASKKLYLIIQLKRSGANVKHLLQTYKSMVRPVIEYGSEIFHPGLTVELNTNIERLQKRALKLITPGLSYEESMERLKMKTLAERRKDQCKKLFERMKEPTHKLNNLIPPARNTMYNLRSQREFNPSIPQSSRTDRGFVNWALLNLQ